MVGLVLSLAGAFADDFALYLLAGLAAGLAVFVLGSGLFLRR